MKPTLMTSSQRRGRRRGGRRLAGIASLALLGGTMLAAGAPPKPAAANFLCYGEMPKPARVGTALRARGTILCADRTGFNPLGTWTLLERRVNGRWQAYGSPELTRCPRFGNDTGLRACEVTDGAPYAAGTYRTSFVFTSDIFQEWYYSGSVTK